VKNERRHSADTAHAARPAIIVMCNPEMEIKWL
jgi:hypothetical protein